MSLEIIPIANQKGGVGKTTTAINLATAMAAVGKKVLLIDLDPQGNASTGLGLDRAERIKTMYEVLQKEKKIDEVVMSTTIPSLDLIPATVDLSGVEIELMADDDRAFRLRDAIKQSHANQTYNYIIIDCPPSLSVLTLNALVAATSVLIPLQCEFFALEGLSLLLSTIEEIKKSFNPELEIYGILLTMFDRRNNLSEQVEADVRSHLGKKVFDTVIPRNIRVSEAPSYGKPSLLYDASCPGSQAYIRLASEILKRESKIRVQERED